MTLTRSDYLENALWTVAASRGSVEELAALIQAGADVKARGEHGNTPLHEAVSHNHLDAIQFLLDHGASAAAKNDDRKTPVELAKTNVVSSLLSSSRIRSL